MGLRLAQIPQCFRHFVGACDLLIAVKRTTIRISTNMKKKMHMHNVAMTLVSELNAFQYIYSMFGWYAYDFQVF